MGNEVWYGVPPGERADPVYDVIVPQPGERWSLTMLGEGWLGLRLWVIPPASERKAVWRACACMEAGRCTPRQTCRWFGFIGVYDHGSRTRALLRAGQESAKSISAKHSAPLGGLRGLRLHVQRGGGPGGRMLVAGRDASPPLSPLPEAPRMRATLRLLLGGYEVDEGAVYGAEDVADVPMPPEGGAL